MKNLYTKIILVPFLLLIAMLILDYTFEIFNSSFVFYLQSIFILQLGMILYPFNFKFKRKADYLFLISIGLFIYNIIYLLTMYQLSFKLNFINIGTGIFSIVLLLVRKKTSLSLKKK